MMTHKGTPTIETHRLILRRTEKEDARPMFRNWASDPEVTKYLTWPTYQKEEDACPIVEYWMGEYSKDNFYHWMIVLKEIGEPIGSIGVVRWQEDISEAEIGYCIGKNWWGRGIMPEAMTVVMGYLFREVGMQRIEAGHDPENYASGAVLRKCGLKYEGTLRRRIRSNRGITDVAWYSLLNEEYNLG
jgi:ribosomal-protein-alanine N-acetyltransferase